jgi:prepilin-type N-terminal cleavage/methylation domain-containing protein
MTFGRNSQMVEHYRRLRRQRTAGERGESGFTLIELLIVIVVMGILAAVVIFALGGVTGKSQVAACNTDAKSVVTAVYAFEAGGNSSTLLTAANGSGLLTGTNYGGPYIQSWPSDTGYSIGVDQASGATTGEVDVKIGTGGTWTVYSPTACVNA